MGLDARTAQNARTAARKAHRSPYKTYDASARIGRAWTFLITWVSVIVAWDLVADRPVPTWAVWTFTVLTALHIVAQLFSPAAARAQKRKNALAQEQVYQVRQWGGVDGTDYVGMGLGNLADADATLDRRTMEATAVFIKTSLAQLLVDVEAQLSTDPNVRRHADRSVRTGIR